MKITVIFYSFITPNQAIAKKKIKVGGALKPKNSKANI